MKFNIPVGLFAIVMLLASAGCGDTVQTDMEESGTTILTSETTAVSENSASGNPEAETEMEITSISAREADLAELEATHIDLLHYFTMPAEDAGVAYSNYDLQSDTATVYVLSVTSEEEDCEFDSFDTYEVCDTDGNLLSGQAFSPTTRFTVPDAEGCQTRILIYRAVGETPSDIVFRVRGDYMDEDEYVEIPVETDSMGDFSRYRADGSVLSVIQINGTRYLYAGFNSTGTTYKSSGSDITGGVTFSFELIPLDGSSFDGGLSADDFSIEQLEENAVYAQKVSERLSITISECEYDEDRLMTCVTVWAYYDYTEDETELSIDENEDEVREWLLNHYLVCEDGCGNTENIYLGR